MNQHSLMLCAAFLVLSVGSDRATGAAAPAPSRSGDTGQSLPFGKQVRITLVTPGSVGASWQSGTLVYSAADSVVLRKAPYEGGDDRVAVLLASTDRMQVRTGRKGHSNTGFIIGGSLGFAAGAAAGIALGQMSGGWYDSEPSNNSGGPAIGGAIFGAMIVGGLGALIGALVRSDKWEEVPLDKLKIGMTTGPTAGPALGMSLRF